MKNINDYIQTMYNIPQYKITALNYFSENAKSISIDIDELNNYIKYQIILNDTTLNIKFEINKK